MRDLV